MPTETRHECGEPDCPWEGAPIISEYTSGQAVEDGVLVRFDGPGVEPGARVNIVTRAVFDAFTSTLLGGAMTDITTLARLLERVVAEGRREDGWVILDRAEGEEAIWLLPNEVGGYTAMFPSDY